MDNPPQKKKRRKYRKYGDLSGKRYGRLVAIRRVSLPSDPPVRYLCQCDCGNEHVVAAQSLFNRLTKSCGCLLLEVRESRITHGMSGTREYNHWRTILSRCNDPDNAWYHCYGARGVKVCDRWQGPDGFANFRADMGPRPSPKHSVDRRDNDGPYAPENCRWATQKEQTRNTRRNVFITAFGKTMVVSAWAEHVGMHPATLRNRLNKQKLDPETALSRPIDAVKQRANRSRVGGG